MVAVSGKTEKKPNEAEKPTRRIYGADEFVPFQHLLQGDSGPRTIDPEKQSRLYLEEKRRLADALIDEARNKTAAIEKAAHDAGFAKGQKEGEEAGRAKYEKTVQKLHEVMSSIEDMRPALHLQYEQELWPVIEAMVRRLAHHEISVNPRVIAACLSKTLEFVSASAIVRVRLHPEDFRRIKEAGLENPDLFAGQERLDLIEDPGVSMGGCLVSSDFGEIDAGFDAFQERLLEAVGQAFLASLAEGQKNEK